MIIPFSAFPQDNMLFMGTVSNSSSGQPLSYVNITVGNIGTYSNLDGKFKLIIPAGNNSTSNILVMSSVSYNTVALLVDTIESGKEYEIKMKASVYSLEEVIIEGERLEIEAKEIVANAISRIAEYTPIDNYVLESFYRQAHYLTNPGSGELKYLHYMEAALLLQSYPGLPYVSRIKEIRRSDDQRVSSYSEKSDTKKLEIQQKFKFEDVFLRLDYLKPTSESKEDLFMMSPVVGNLNNDFIKRHKFKIDTITHYNDELVYVIKILPSKKSLDINTGLGKHFYVPIGRLFITGEDYYILEVQYSYILNCKEKDNLSCKINLARSQGQELFFDVVKYKKINGKLYLNYLLREEGDHLYVGGLAASGLIEDNASKPDELGFFRVRRELVIIR